MDITSLLDKSPALGLIGLALYALYNFAKWKGVKSNNTLREEYQKSFDQIVTNLASDNTSTQLTAAILLRRFFFIKEIKTDETFLKAETVSVISSLLRTLPTNVFQKTVGDGLAYAQDLTKADLQRTNLQDIYLESKSNQRLILNNADFYMADLSYALVKNVDAQGAYLYHSILFKTVFKNCNLENADFRFADLTNATFENVTLNGADFSHATNIPQNIKEGLKDEVRNGEIRKIYKGLEVVSTVKQTTLKNIFFSIPGCTQLDDNAYIVGWKKKLEDMGYEVICYTRDQYPQFGQLNKIRHDIIRSSAMVVFGLKQIKIDKGTFRPETKEQVEWNKKWLPTPWNDIEVGLGIMKGLPILLIKDEDIDSGIFDSHLSECFIATISTSTLIDKAIESQPFEIWNAQVKSTVTKVSNTEDLANNEPLIYYLAELQHQLWCKERMEQGWTYGPVRNDELKQSPCLVPFNKLPKAEQDFDIKACINTLEKIDDFLSATKKSN